MPARPSRWCTCLLAAGLALAAVAWGADEQGEFAFAQHLMGDRMYDLAGQQLQEFIDNHPASPLAPDAFLLLAQAYAERQGYARAADTYQGFIVKYPQDVRVRELWLKMADMRAQAGQDADAARAYLDLADAYPESDFADDALLGGGASLIRLNEFDRAERALTRLLERYPRSNSVDRARVLLGQARLARGQAAEAMRTLSPVLQKQDPTNDVADALVLGTDAALAQGQPAEARRLSDRLVLQVPGDDRTWKARMALATYLVNRSKTAGNASGGPEDLNQAADLYKEASRRAGSPALGEAAVFNLARVRELQHAPALAISNWRDLLARYPTGARRTDAMLGLGRAYLAAGDSAAAGVFALEELLATYTDSAQAVLALDELAAYYDRRGDAASALAYYEREHVRTRDEAARRRLVLRMAALREGPLDEPDQARTMYAGLAGGTDDVAAQAQFGLARCFRALGRIDEAEEAYQQVTRRFGTHPLAAAARDSLTLIEHFLRPDLSGAMLAMIRVESSELETNADAATSRRERMLELAKIKVQYLKDYPGAISLLRLYLAEQGAASPDEAEHLLAQCYLRLATRARLVHDSTAASAARREALAALARLAERYPESSRADDAFIETTEAALATVDSASRQRRVLDAYRGFFGRYPQSDRRDFVLVRMAEATVAPARTGGGSPDEALRQFNEALQIAPDGPVLDQALYGSARILAQQGQQEEAERRLGRLIAERPLSALVPDARYQLAVILMERRQPRLAARELEKLLQGGEGTRNLNEVRGKLVTAYEATGSYEQVTPIAQEMAASQDPVAAAWGARHLAAAYLQLRRTDDAERALAAELAARPEAPDADSLTLRWAQILVERRRFERALPALTGFERRYPRSRLVPQAWRMLADVQFELNSFEEALVSYRRVLQAESGDKAARMGEIVSLYRLAKTNDAQPRERSLRDLGGLTAEDEVRLSIERGHALMGANDYEGAINAFARVVEEHPESQWADDALLADGRACASSGRIEPAVQAFERIIRLYPDSPLRQEAAFELGTTYFNSQFYERAADTYRRALDMDTTSTYAPDAMWNLVLSYEQVQQVDPAIRTMRTFLRRFPADEHAGRMRVKIAEDLNQLGEFPQSVAAYQEALDMLTGPDVAEARFGLGEAYFNMGEYRMAVVEWLKLAYYNQTQSRWAVTALFRAAKADEKMGKLEDARVLYRKIITMQGEGSDMGRAAALQLMALDR